MQDFRKFLKDDGALLRAADARWLLVPSQTASLEHSRAINGAGPHASDSDDEAPMQACIPRILDCPPRHDFGCMPPIILMTVVHLKRQSGGLEGKPKWWGCSSQISRCHGTCWAR